MLRPVVPRLAVAAFVLSFAAPLVSAQSVQQAGYPLDALTSAEHWAAYQALNASGKMDSTTKFVSVTLKEPLKKDVLAWKPGQSFTREAMVVLRQQKTTVEATVDLKSGKVETWTLRPNDETMFTEADQGKVSDLIKNDPRVRAALKRRGVTDFNTIECYAGPLGYFGGTGPRRVGKGGCSSSFGSYNNNNAHGYDGLVVTVDMDTPKIMEVIDDGGLTPLPPGMAEFTREALGTKAAAPKPIVVTQPDGPGFTMTGSEIAWEKWRFHVRMDSRIGTVLSRVRWDDGQKERSIMYEGSLSEIFVPYQDPANGWYDRVFIDAGEYSRTGLAKQLDPGVDCPSYSVYLDGIVTTTKGAPQLKPTIGCIFERTSGDVAWRHGQYSGRVEARPKRDLVVRMAAVIGNYDYVLDWILQQDGSIKVAVGATGIVEAKPVAVKDIASASNAPGSLGDAPDKYGHLLAQNVLGINHDHFFNYRLDLDVDGTGNSLELDRMVTQRLPAGSPRKSVWVVEKSTAKTESEAKLHQEMDAPALWRVINPSVHGPVGYPTSYQIMGGHSTMSLLSKDDWPQIRAGFSDYELWVTPYAPDEKYAAGDYPTLSRGPEGLPTYTKDNRKIENTDIVAWYTMGFHHVVRAEDWPVMPTATHTFEIRPFDFFPQNPAMDLPMKQ